MATFRGMDGSVSWAAGAVAQVTAWNANVNAEVLEDSSMGLKWRTHKGGMIDWTGVITARLDYGDTAGQKAMLDTILGASPSLGAAATELIIAGSTKKLSGSAIVVSAQITQQLGNIVEVQMTVRGTGALTIAWT